MKKVLLMIDVLLFLGLVISIIGSNGSKIELILCALIAVISSTLIYQGKKNRG